MDGVYVKQPAKRTGLLFLFIRNTYAAAVIIFIAQVALKRRLYILKSSFAKTVAELLGRTKSIGDLLQLLIYLRLKELYLRL